VALSRETVKVLAEHRRQQLEHRLALGPAYDADADLVFANPLGKPSFSLHLNSTQEQSLRHSIIPAGA